MKRILNSGLSSMKFMRKIPKMKNRDLLRKSESHGRMIFMKKSSVWA